MLRDATRVTLAAVPLHQGGVSDKAQPDSSLPHLIHERRSAMNGIALGTSVKHGVESHRVQADAPVLHLLVSAEDVLGTPGNDKTFQHGGVRHRVDEGPVSSESTWLSSTRSNTRLMSRWRE